MAIKRPTPSQLRAVAHDLGMTLTDDDLHSYLDLMAGSFGAYDAVDAMPDFLPEVKYPRTPGYQPEGTENPYNAWYVKTTVKGAPTGRPARRWC
jgi:amidase